MNCETCKFNTHSDFVLLICDECDKDYSKWEAVETKI